MTERPNFELVMEKQLGPNWRTAVTPEAIEFYKTIYDAGHTAGWVARDKHNEMVSALKRIDGVLNGKR